MIKPLSSVYSKIKPTVLAAAEKQAQAILVSMPLPKLRHAHQLSQAQLADTLHVKKENSD